jgi:hypothetical protein
VLATLLLGRLALLGGRRRMGLHARDSRGRACWHPWLDQPRGGFRDTEPALCSWPHSR